MRKLFDRLTRCWAPNDPARAHPSPPTEPSNADSSFFATQFLEPSVDTAVVATWAERAARVGAQAMERSLAEPMFTRLWGADRYVSELAPHELLRLSQYLRFVTVPADREVISQDEQGDYMLIVLEGLLAVDRIQPWGGRARLAEARAGDMLGEMALLDSGTRFSACTTLAPCALAVVDAHRLDEMILHDPRLGAALMASLSRRLSVRLRQVSARLSAQLTQP